MAGVIEAESEAPQLVRPLPVTCTALPGMPPASGTGAPSLGVVVPVLSVDRYQPPMRPSTAPTSALPSSKSSMSGGVPVAAADIMQVATTGPAPPAALVPAAAGVLPAVPVVVPALPVVRPPAGRTPPVPDAVPAAATPAPPAP